MEEDDVALQLEPEEQLEVEVGADIDNDDEAEEPFVYSEDAANLVDQFAAHPDGREALRKISEEVRRNFDSDWESSDEYRQRIAEDWRIFSGELPAKEWPWKDCSNAHVPIMIENISRNSMRMYAELFGDWQNVFGVSPVGSTEAAQQEAEILSAHGNWQIRNQIPNFKRQMERAILANYTIGDFTIHSFYDPDTATNKHELLTPDEFVIPYVHVTTDPNYGDVPRMSKVIMLYRHQLEARRQDWYDVDKLLKNKPPSWDEEPDQPLARAVAEVQGNIPDPDGDETAPYKILLYEGWMELPNDTNQRYVQVIMDYASKIVLKLAIHEEADWRDQERFNHQMTELEGFRHAEAMHQQAMMQHEGMKQQVAMGAMTGELGPLQAQHSAQALEAEAPMPPMPPPWLTDPGDPTAAPPPVKKVPIRLFTHGVCIESLRGSLGFGYGRIQADYNRAANTALSQFTDAATLANCWGLLVAGSIDIPNFEWKPGAVVKVPGLSAGEMQSGIRELRPQAANTQLLDSVKLFQEFGQSSMQAPDVLSGEPGKSGETYRGISARIEQATKQLSVVTRKFADVLQSVLMNNARLNARFLADEEIINISDQRPRPLLVKVGRALYQRDYRVEIRADLRFATQPQRISEADELVAMALQNPVLMQTPVFLWHATKKALEARGRYDMVQLMGPPPMPAPPPMMMGPNGPQPVPPQMAPPQHGPPPQGQQPNGKPPGPPQHAAPPPMGPQQ